MEVDFYAFVFFEQSSSIFFLWWNNISIQDINSVGIEKESNVDLIYETFKSIENHQSPNWYENIIFRWEHFVKTPNGKWVRVHQLKSGDWTRCLNDVSARRPIDEIVMIWCSINADNWWILTVTTWEALSEANWIVSSTCFGLENSTRINFFVWVVKNIITTFLVSSEIRREFVASDSDEVNLKSPHGEVEMDVDPFLFW